MRDKDSTLLTEAYASILTEMRLDQAMVAVRKAAAEDGGYVADILNDLDPRNQPEAHSKLLTYAEFQQLVGALNKIPGAESTPELQHALANIKFDVEEPRGKMPSWTPERDKAYGTAGSEEHGLGDDSFAGIEPEGDAGKTFVRNSDGKWVERTWLVDFYNKFDEVAKQNSIQPEEVQSKKDSSLAIISTLQDWDFKASEPGGADSHDSALNLVYYGNWNNANDPGAAIARCSLNLDHNLDMGVTFQIYLEQSTLTHTEGLPAEWAERDGLKDTLVADYVKETLEPDLNVYMPYEQLNRVVNTRAKMAQYIVKRINRTSADAD